MGGLSLWHLIFMLIIWVVWIVPLYRIFGKIGFPKWLAFIALFPPAGIVMLWVIAFTKWKST